jgi:hypothetical protein
VYEGRRAENRWRGGFLEPLVYCVIIVYGNHLGSEVIIILGVHRKYLLHLRYRGVRGSAPEGESFH